jgi:hypothetical protein
MIYMWQEEKKKPYYRFQTDDRKAMEKMKRREKFKLSGKACNCDLWIFTCQFSRPDIAKKTLQTLAGGKVKYDKYEEIYYAGM